jgi:hypothetical protein
MPTRNLVVGGGARSPLWCQIIADISGRPVFLARTSQTTALRAGILAAAGVGLHSSVITAAQAMILSSLCFLRLLILILFSCLCAFKMFRHLTSPDLLQKNSNAQELLSWNSFAPEAP